MENEEVSKEKLIEIIIKADKDHITERETYYHAERTAQYILDYLKESE